MCMYITTLQLQSVELILNIVSYMSMHQYIVYQIEKTMQEFHEVALCLQVCITQGNTFNLANI